MYQVETDAAGYPNGMPYWPEMPINDQYYYSVNAITLLEYAKAKGLITFVKDFGLRESSWGEGDCKALVEELERRQPEEQAELERRIAIVRAAYKSNVADKGKTG
jgi:hypothetical protein